MIVLKATQDKVLSVLQSVAGIVERRHTLPILSNVLLEKQGDRLTLLATDIEIQITTSTEVTGADGDAHRGAIGAIFCHVIGRGVGVRDRADIELVHVRDVDREALCAGGTIGTGGDHGEIGRGWCWERV